MCASNIPKCPKQNPPLRLFNVTVLQSSRSSRSAYTPKDLKALASYVLSSLKVRKPVELAIDIVGHRRIRELNRRYRGVDRTTDVISFRNEPFDVRRPTSDVGPWTQDALCGDIAINIQQAAVQARSIGHPLRREIRLLIIHGILHLFGYTDYAPEPRRRMFRRQNALLLHWERKHR
jgi:probable rRNA maturation factor